MEDPADWNNLYIKNGSAVLWNQTGKILFDWLFQNIKIPKFAEILDVGCGNGAKSHYLSKLGYKVTGIDFSDEAIRISKNGCESLSNPPNFLVCDIREIKNSELKLDNFDLIIDLLSSQFLDREEQEKYFEFVRRNSKPGLVYVLSIFSDYNLKLKNTSRWVQEISRSEEEVAAWFSSFEKIAKKSNKTKKGYVDYYIWKK